MHTPVEITLTLFPLSERVINITTLINDYKFETHPESKLDALVFNCVFQVRGYLLHGSYSIMYRTYNLEFVKGKGYLHGQMLVLKLKYNIT